MKTKCLKVYHQVQKVMTDPHMIPIATTLALTTISLYVPEVFALNSTDQIEELTSLTQEVGKLTKVACYVIGTASAAIGTLWSVAAQSLKVAAGSGAVTILAFKAPAFFAQSMII